MRALLKRYAPSRSLQLAFSCLYAIKRKLKYIPALDAYYTKCLSYYPGVLLYFQKRESEQLIFPYQPQSTGMASQEIQQLYRKLQYISRNHANHH